MGVMRLIVSVLCHLPDLVKGRWIHPTQAAEVLDELLPQ
jgi:hypothetical protein